jgi:hypothetical protein
MWPSWCPGGVTKFPGPVLTAGSGDGFEADVVAELLELVHEVALAAVGVIDAGGVVGAHLLVGDVVVEDVQITMRRW